MHGSPGQGLLTVLSQPICRVPAGIYAKRRYIDPELERRRPKYGGTNCVQVAARGDLQSPASLVPHYCCLDAEAVTLRV